MSSSELPETMAANWELGRELCTPAFDELRTSAFEGRPADLDTTETRISTWVLTLPHVGDTSGCPRPDWDPPDVTLQPLVNANAATNQLVSGGRATGLSEEFGGLTLLDLLRML
ncbi:hypothetical protein PAL_GLEAN10021976 [Pteropus alecto]|uniref:Uncharacterized protein n=1 Tax=Pteropus alecto TaxID=9402 RepID=L5KLY9_PTEAL|nr:hypothetical protein PAL_GLEAN10021976 [Pteropus alecto]